MSVLSDSEILEYLGRNELVVRGERADVGSNSYQFRPGQILPAGATPDQGILDWSQPKPTDEFIALPGGMFWVRTSHEVCLPKDVCAFWWQTNSLSKKGIMLVNMSMVEPGYRGPLACLFVNFGNDRVAIRPTTTVAKLVFMKLSRAAEKPFAFSTSLKVYDEELRNVSLSAPESFLRVSEQAKNLEREYAHLKSQLDQEAKQHKDLLERDAKLLKEQVAQETRAASEKVLDEFLKDLPGKIRHMWISLVLAGVAVALGFWIFNVVGDMVRPKTEDRIKALVEDEVNKATNHWQILLTRGSLSSTGSAAAVPPAAPGTNAP